MKRLLSFIILFLCLFVAAPVWGATYCLSDDGTAGSKTVVTDCTDMSDCMNEAVFNGETFSTDTVLLCDNDGDITTGLIVPSDGITLTPYAGETVTITAGIEINAKSNVTIDGNDSLTVQDTSGSIILIRANSGSDTGNVVRETILEGGNGESYGVSVIATADDTLLNTTVTENTIYNIGDGSSAHMSVRVEDNGGDVDGVTISNNEIYGNNVDAGVDGIQVNSADAVTISNNYIHDFNWANGENCIDIKNDVNDIVISENRCTNTWGPAIIVHSYNTAMSGDVTIKHNSLSNSEMGNSGGCIRVYPRNGSNITGTVAIYGNLIYDSDGYGVKIENDAGDPSTASSILIYNNTFVDNAGHGIHVENAALGADALVIKNNIFDGNDTSTYYQIYLADDEEDVISDYNLGYYAGQTAVVYCGASGSQNFNDHDFDGCDTDNANNDSADPSFVARASDNFRLASDSPCINDGDSTLGAAYDDALDNATGQVDFTTTPPTVNTLDQDSYGSGWEIGAFVYGGVDIGTRDGGDITTSTLLEGAAVGMSATEGQTIASGTTCQAYDSHETEDAYVAGPGQADGNRLRCVTRTFPAGTHEICSFTVQVSYVGGDITGLNYYAEVWELDGSQDFTGSQIGADSSLKAGVNAWSDTDIEFTWAGAQPTFTADGSTEYAICFTHGATDAVNYLQTNYKDADVDADWNWGRWDNSTPADSSSYSTTTDMYFKLSTMQ